MAGENGDDTYIVDNAGDLVTEIASGGLDTVESAVTFSLAETVQAIGEIENLILLGNANINGTGNVLANVISGNAGANRLTALAGDDTLAGGAGRDVLSGGDGADKFVFDATLNKKTNVDTIADFASDDTIVLDRDIFTKLKLGALKDKAFHEGKKAHDGNDRIIYNDKNGKLIYDKNGDKDGGGKVFAKLVGAPDLDSADFLVI